MVARKETPPSQCCARVGAATRKTLTRKVAGKECVLQRVEPALTSAMIERMSGRRSQLQLVNLHPGAYCRKGRTSVVIRNSCLLCAFSVVSLTLVMPPLPDLAVASHAITAPLALGVFAAPESGASTLRQLAARRGIEIGAAVSDAAELQDPEYTRILVREFGLLVMGGDIINWNLPPRPSRPSRTTYDFSRADAVIAFSEKNGMRVQGHHLLWGMEEALPSWLTNGRFSRDELLSIIHDHIQTVVGRYRGRVQEWVVINEVVSRALFGGGGVLPGGGDFWYNHIGPDYLVEAFRWARQADPSAKLILNDFDNEEPNRVSNRLYTTVKGFKDSGIPIDGVGMQMHVDGTKPPRKDLLTANMRRFGALGVSVYVTEFDVDVSGLRGTTDQKYAVQAQIYKDILSACLQSGVCKSFSTFEFSDDRTWYATRLHKANTDPLPFDKNFRPKPAYEALKAALTEVMR